MSRKVLIVDDSKLARMAVAKILSGLHPDWRIEEAANAERVVASNAKTAKRRPIKRERAC